MMRKHVGTHWLTEPPPVCEGESESEREREREKEREREREREFVNE